MNWRRFIPVIIVMAGIMAYYNSFQGRFVFDDGHSIVENQHIRQVWPPWTAMINTTRPLVQWSLAFNYACGKLNPWGYHLFNLTVHLLAALTLYGVVRRTLVCVYGCNGEGARAVELQKARALELLSNGAAKETDIGGKRSVASSQATNLVEPAVKTSSPRWSVAHQHSKNTAATLAGIITLTWVVHPLNTQAVTYIIQRGESMMGLFYLLTLYCFIRAVDVPEALTSDSCGSGDSVPDLRSPVSGPQHRCFIWLAASLLACCAGMGCKEVMFTAPLMVLIYDWLFAARSLQLIVRCRTWYYLSLFATCAIPLILSTCSMTADSHAGFGMTAVSPWQYASTQPGIILHYLRLSVCPVDLCFDYLWSVAQGFWQITPPLLVVSGLGLLTLSLLACSRALAFPCLWLFGVLSITSSIMPIADLAVEHRMYLALIAPVVLIVLGCHQLLVMACGSNSSMVGLASASAVVSVLAIGTTDRNKVYHSEYNLCIDVLRNRPLNYRAHVTLAHMARMQNRTNGSDGHYRRVIELVQYHANHIQATRYLGVAQFYLGDYQHAYTNLSEAVKSASRPADLWNMLGLISLRQERNYEAANDFAKATGSNPLVLEYWFNLGLAYSRMDRHADAAMAFHEAVRIDPKDGMSHHRMALALWYQGLHGEAVGAWRQAVRVDPQLWPAVYDLAWALATHPDSRVRNGVESLVLAERITQSLRKPDGLALEVLAAAYAECGRFDDAIKALDQAMTIPLLSEGTIIPFNEQAERLAMYHKSRPWRMKETKSHESVGNNANGRGTTQ